MNPIIGSGIKGWRFPGLIRAAARTTRWHRACSGPAVPVAHRRASSPKQPRRRAPVTCEKNLDQKRTPSLVGGAGQPGRAADSVARAGLSKQPVERAERQGVWRSGGMRRRLRLRRVDERLRAAGLASRERRLTTGRGPMRRRRNQVRRQVRAGGARPRELSVVWHAMHGASVRQRGVHRLAMRLRLPRRLRALWLGLSRSRRGCCKLRSLWQRMPHASRRHRHLRPWHLRARLPTRLSRLLGRVCRCLQRPQSLRRLRQQLRY